MNIYQFLGFFLLLFGAILELFQYYFGSSIYLDIVSMIILLEGIFCSYKGKVLASNRIKELEYKNTIQYRNDRFFTEKVEGYILSFHTKPDFFAKNRFEIVDFFKSKTLQYEHCDLIKRLYVAILQKRNILDNVFIYALSVEILGSLELQIDDEFFLMLIDGTPSKIVFGNYSIEVKKANLKRVLKLLVNSTVGSQELFDLSDLKLLYERVLDSEQLSSFAYEYFNNSNNALQMTLLKS